MWDPVQTDGSTITEITIGSASLQIEMKEETSQSPYVKEGFIVSYNQIPRIKGSSSTLIVQGLNLAADVAGLEILVVGSTV